MTGEPSFTFRDQDENPVCPACGGEMLFVETVTGEFNERDVYECEECGDVFEDRWTF